MNFVSSGRPDATDPSDPRAWNLTFTPVDDLEPDQRWSNWNDIEKGCRGPEPCPGWVVTDHAAVDTELGVLKTGKEADVYLLERAVPGQDGVLLAAKRYRSVEHRTFHRSAAYTEGRGTRRTRDSRALATKSAYGQVIAAGTWAAAEFEALSALWSAGVPVPYPVQVDETELLMEFIVGEDGETAPRLAQVRPDPRLLEAYFDQLRQAMIVMARLGVAHGDLSGYNILAAGERVVIIDLPQIVDLVANPQGMDFLLRDCHNIGRWFASRGLDVDAESLFAELVGSAFGDPIPKPR